MCYTAAQPAQTTLYSAIYNTHTQCQQPLQSLAHHDGAPLQTSPHTLMSTHKCHCPQLLSLRKPHYIQQSTTHIRSVNGHNNRSLTAHHRQLAHHDGGPLQTSPHTLMSTHQYILAYATAHSCSAEQTTLYSAIYNTHTQCQRP